MSSTSVRFTIIEWAAAAAIVLLAARLIWAHELFAAEERFFELLGLSGEKRFFAAVPLAAWWAYRIYARERVRSQATGLRLIRLKVIVVAVMLLLLCSAILAYTLRA